MAANGPREERSFFKTAEALEALDIDDLTWEFHLSLLFLKQINSDLWELTIKAYRLKQALALLVRYLRERLRRVWSHSHTCHPHRGRARALSSGGGEDRVYCSLGYRWSWGEIYERQKYIMMEVGVWSLRWSLWRIKLEMPSEPDVLLLWDRMTCKEGGKPADSDNVVQAAEEKRR